MQKSPRIAEISTKVVGDSFLCSPCISRDALSLWRHFSETYHKYSSCEWKLREKVFIVTGQGHMCTMCEYYNGEVVRLYSGTSRITGFMLMQKICGDDGPSLIHNASM